MALGDDCSLLGRSGDGGGLCAVGGLRGSCIVMGRYRYAWDVRGCFAGIPRCLGLRRSVKAVRVDGFDWNGSVQVELSAEVDGYGVRGCVAGGSRV